MADIGEPIDPKPPFKENPGPGGKTKVDHTELHRIQFQDFERTLIKKLVKIIEGPSFTLFQKSYERNDGTTVKKSGTGLIIKLETVKRFMDTFFSSPTRAVATLAVLGASIPAIVGIGVGVGFIKAEHAEAATAIMLKYWENQMEFISQISLAIFRGMAEALKGQLPFSDPLGEGVANIFKDQGMADGINEIFPGLAWITKGWSK